MPVTIGQYEYMLDPKNRLVVPPRYRDALAGEKGASFILAKGFDPCIWLFLPSQWELIRAEFSAHVKTFKDAQTARDLQRIFYGTAEEAGLDEQGRILVPHMHKDYAGLQKEVMIVGTGSKAEIWDRARWDAHVRKKAGPAFEKLAKNLPL